MTEQPHCDECGEPYATHFASYGPEYNLYLCQHCLARLQELASDQTKSKTMPETTETVLLEVQIAPGKYLHFDEESCIASTQPLPAKVSLTTEEFRRINLVLLRDRDYRAQVLRLIADINQLDG